jgi:hypothetical protein
LRSVPGMRLLIGLVSSGLLLFYAARASAQSPERLPQLPAPPVAAAPASPAASPPPPGYTPYPPYPPYGYPPPPIVDASYEAAKEADEEAEERRKEEREDRMRMKNPALFAGGIGATAIGGGGLIAGVLLTVTSTGFYTGGNGDKAAQAGGIGLLVGGAVLVAAGVSMIVIGRKRELGPAPPAVEEKTIWVSAGPRGGVVGGSF